MMSETTTGGRSAQRFGSVTRLLSNHKGEYLRLHADVWPDVRHAIRDHGVVNHSIFYFDGLLFRYYEYIGQDHSKDSDAMAQDPRMVDWFAATDRCQENALGHAGPKWSAAAEVCHLD